MAKKPFTNGDEQTLLPSDNNQQIDPASQAIEPSSDPSDWYFGAQGVKGLANLGVSGVKAAYPTLERLMAPAIEDAGKLVGNEVGSIGSNVLKNAPTEEQAAISSLNKEAQDQFRNPLVKDPEQAQKLRDLADKAQSAKDAARTDFELVGDPQSKDFELKGEPYGGSVAKIPQEAEVAQEAEKNLPAVQQKPAIDADYKVLDNKDLYSKLKSLPPDKLKQLVAAGVIPAGILAMLGQDSGSVSSDQSSAQPPSIDSPMAKKAAAPNASNEDDDADEEDEDEKKTPSPKAAAPAAAAAQPVSPSVPPMNFGSSIGTDAAMQEAQKQRNMQQAVNNLGRAGDIAFGGAYGPTMGKYYDEQDKLANQPITDLQERIANEKNDPNSAISISYAKFMEKVGVPGLEGKVPASAMEKAFPVLQHYQTAHEKQLDRAVQLQVAQNQKAQIAQDKLDKQDTDRLDKMNKALTAETASSRSSFGRSANTYNSAEKVQTLINQMGNVDKLNTRQIAELARQLDSILSNGQATISGMNKLIPESYAGSLAKIEEYITNINQPAHMGSFVKNMADTVEREKQLAHDQMQRTQGKILGSYGDIYKRSPERFGAVLAAQGLPDDIMENNSPREISNTPAPKQFSPKQESIIKKYTDQGYDRNAVIKQLHLE